MNGATEALYSRCRRFTIPIESTITSAAAPSWTNCAVRNCDEPANTMDDIACASPGVIPEPSAAAP
jgi:hypothetical protein